VSVSTRADFSVNVDVSEMIYDIVSLNTTMYTDLCVKTGGVTTLVNTPQLQRRFCVLITHNQNIFPGFLRNTSSC